MVDEAYTVKYGRWSGTKATGTCAQRCLNLVKVPKFLDHAPTRAAMIESGWISA